MSGLDLLARYLRDGLFDDADFANSFVQDQESDSNWTLRRSYSAQGHAIREHFNIQLFDQDDIPLVKCSLKLFIQSLDAPQDDTREKIFKPRSWFGPDLDIEVIEQQVDSQHRPTTTPLLPASTSTNSVSQSLTEESVLPSIIPGPEPATKTLTGKVAIKKDRSLEHRMLTTAKAFVRGIQILVSKPQGNQAKRLRTIRKCFDTSARNEHPIETGQLMLLWMRLKSDKTPIGQICDRTTSKTKDLELSVASIKNVGNYIAGITELENARKARDNGSKYLCGRALDRILKVISRLIEYYGTVAITVFTFLEVGGFGVARLGNTAIKGADNERYFYDGLVALIDLSLRRFVATARETEADAIPDSIPVLNPVAFHWWYEGEKGCYEDLCQNLRLPAFANATPNTYTERPPSMILDVCEPGSNSPDKSTDFILQNAQRLAKYMSCKDEETYLKSFEGDKEKHDMAKLASRILNGTSSQEELLTAPTDVVYMIVEMLLLDSRSKQGVKRKRASGNEQDKRSDGSRFHHDLRQPVSPVDLLDQNTRGQAAPLTGGMDISQGLPPLDQQFPPGFFDIDFEGMDANDRLPQFDSQLALDWANLMDMDSVGTGLSLFGAQGSSSGDVFLEV
ncbi:hypothetical protein MAC_03320 [Metarhizium acridum CQMa 102]|uniref:Uncharacterized protein n=1 Tax=Metarhizium acridum (strain CQMa 102) TaxID=655827 RepID=E9E0C2_METAQ|nr:uncharacterized protein MAC_03320 [Metarhizium acridum CQMa 102]EFY90542.1 hypothetical protein MAC_03320 [Metarhizium acridum CQMa 102]